MPDNGKLYSQELDTEEITHTEKDMLQANWLDGLQVCGE